MSASAPAEPSPGPARGLTAASLLLVEDEPSVGALVRTYLERSGYRVAWVRTGEDAIADAQRNAYDLVILDVGLPGIDGFDVCRLLRARSRVPVVMLTARDEESDRVAGLELGADDYVSKPFSPRELAARVKAVLRRTTPTDEELPEVLSLEDVEVRPREREARVAGEPVTLTAKELDLLMFLLEHPGIVFSREQLLDRVWGLAYPGGTRTVDVHVAQLRRKLGRPDLIRTVRGAGYKTARA
jgi:DNA-binding response OmpR family regulator